MWFKDADQFLRSGYLLALKDPAYCLVNDPSGTRDEGFECVAQLVGLMRLLFFEGFKYCPGLLDACSGRIDQDGDMHS